MCSWMNQKLHLKSKIVGVLSRLGEKRQCIQNEDQRLRVQSHFLSVGQLILSWNINFKFLKFFRRPVWKANLFFEKEWKRDRKGWELPNNSLKKYRNYWKWNVWWEKSADLYQEIGLAEKIDQVKIRTILSGQKLVENNRIESKWLKWPNKNIHWQIIIYWQFHLDLFLGSKESLDSNLSRQSYVSSQKSDIPPSKPPRLEFL